MTTAVVADYSIVYALAGFMTFMMFIMGILLLWVKLGGWPEGTYRMFRIPYFSAIFLDAGRTPRRFPIKLSELKTEAPDLPQFFLYKVFTKDKARYYTHPSIATRHNGRDSWYYFPDNPYPIDWISNQRKDLISAQQLEKALDSNLMEDFLGIGKPKVKPKGWKRLLYGAVAFIVFVVMIAVISSSLGLIK